MRKSHPCPNQPTTGLASIRSDYKECASPWLCEKLGCQYRDPDKEPIRGTQAERYRRRIDRILGACRKALHQ